MKKIITILAALAVTLSFANAADGEKKDGARKGRERPAGERKGGEKGGRNPEDRFKKLDTNGDGSISADEFKASPMAQKDSAKADEMFKKKDTDNDGKLSMTEISGGGGRKREK
jgi:hypothetical protein